MPQRTLKEDKIYPRKYEYNKSKNLCYIVVSPLNQIIASDLIFKFQINSTIIESKLRENFEFIGYIKKIDKNEI